MKIIATILLVLILTTTAFAQMEIFNQVGEYQIYNSVELRVFNNNIYFADAGYFQKIINSDPKNIEEMIDRKTEVFNNPKYFNIFGMFNSSDSLLILSTNNAVFVRRNSKWNEFEDSTSVLNENAMTKFSMSGDTVVMFAQNTLGPYFLIGDSIYVQKFEFDNYDKLANHSFTVVSLNHKFYYISYFFDLIEFDMDGYRKYGKELYADNPENEAYRANTFLSVSKNKIWFASSENYIISFDGKKFERNNVLKNYLDEVENPRYINMMVVDLQGNIWVDFIVYSKEGSYNEIIRIDTDNNITVPIRTTDPEFTMEAKGISALAVDQSDLSNQKLYFEVNNQYIGIYDPATDVLEIERIPILYFHKVYPNPIKTTASVEFYTSKQNLTAVRFECSDYLGRTFELLQPGINHDASTGKAIAELDFSSALPGLYILSIKANGEAMSKLIIIE